VAGRPRGCGHLAPAGDMLSAIKISGSRCESQGLAGILKIGDRNGGEPGPVGSEAGVWGQNHVRGVAQDQTSRPFPRPQEAAKPNARQWCFCSTSVRAIQHAAASCGRHQGRSPRSRHRLTIDPEWRNGRCPAHAQYARADQLVPIPSNRTPRLQHCSGCSGTDREACHRPQSRRGKNVSASAPARQTTPVAQRMQRLP